ncbi:MAG TPA: hypothetical protein VH641_06605 [Streptosporangiaceae bacterium]
MRSFRHWLRPTGSYAWRWLSGVPRDGEAGPAAGGFTPAHPALPPDVAPPPSGNLLAEIRWDARQLRAEWHELRVRRALGREYRGIERQVLAEQDPGES